MMRAYITVRKHFLLSVAMVLVALTAFSHPLPKGDLHSKQVQMSIDSGATTKAVPIAFRSGKYLLQGKLIAPKNSSGKVPAIVFCVGSSKSSSMESYASFLDSLFEQNLPLDSVALLYFDKRGVGESEGKWYRTNFEERAADAKAAADYLKALPFIDSTRVAVAGHSQGGWIAQLCVAQYPGTFVGGISMAGPTFDVREQVRNDYASMLMCEEGMTEEEARQKALKMMKRDFFLASLFPVKENWKQLKVIKSHNPAQYLTAVEKPLLLLFGENDALVSPTYSNLELQKIFPQRLPANIQGVTIKGANHSFKLTELCHRGSTRDLPYAQECKDQIVEWVRQHLLK